MKLKIKDKSKVKFGKVEFPEDAFDPKNVKWRVNCYADEDIVNWLRAEGKSKGIGYQTMLNMKLRESMEGVVSNDNLDSRLRRLEKIVKDRSLGYSASPPARNKPLKRK